MNDNDWDDQWGRAQDTAAVIMGAGISSLAGFVVGLATYVLYASTWVGAGAGISMLLASLWICFRGSHD